MHRQQTSMRPIATTGSLETACRGWLLVPGMPVAEAIPEDTLGSVAGDVWANLEAAVGAVLGEPWATGDHATHLYACVVTPGRADPSTAAFLDRVPSWAERVAGKVRGRQHSAGCRVPLHTHHKNILVAVAGKSIDISKNIAVEYLREHGVADFLMDWQDRVSGKQQAAVLDPRLNAVREVVKAEKAEWATRMIVLLTPILTEVIQKNPPTCLEAKRRLAADVNALLYEAGIAFKFPGRENEPASLLAKYSGSVPNGWFVLRTKRTDLEQGTQHTSGTVASLEHLEFIPTTHAPGRGRPKPQS